jgi:hypothetical protein
MGDVEFKQLSLTSVASHKRTEVLIMRIVNAELLMPTAEEIKKIVKMAYETGRAKGREEATRELQGFVASPDNGNTDACDAESISGEPDREATIYRIFTAGKY